MKPATQPVLDRRREDFPSLDAGIHLLSHSLGPVPRSATASMLEYLERWKEHPSEDAWATAWMELCSRVGDGIGRLIGAAAGSVQVQSCATAAMASAASCFDFGPGCRNKIVTSALDFPSMAYFWDQQRRLGAEIHVVPSDDGIVTPPERILEAIDEETCLVALTHTAYRSSFRLDPVPIVKRAREAGARVLLDIYQSAGITEIRAADWGVDFLIGGTIKWLCGGPAAGYLYIRPDLLPELKPRLTGWFAHENPMGFESGPIRYAGDARRFAQGTPSIPALYSVLPGISILEQVGLPVLVEESQRRTRWMVAFARERGWKLNCPLEADRRGGSVMIGVEDPRAMVARLIERKVFVDCRPSVGLRISPHFFNTDEEVARAMEILAELI